METFRHQMENGNPGDFPLSVYLLLIFQTEVCPFVDEETNGSYPFANGLNGLAHLRMYSWHAIFHLWFFLLKLTRLVPAIPSGWHVTFKSSGVILLPLLIKKLVTLNPLPIFPVTVPLQLSVTAILNVN
jgi:hypothetical protein